MESLEYLEMQANGLEMIPGSVEWPPRLQKILLQGNRNLASVGSNAFTSATNLTTLSFEGCTKLNSESDSFRISSKSVNKTITLTSVNGTFDGNAFGNIGGGQLWDFIRIADDEFSEEVYRLLLKSYFNKAYEGN